MYIDEFLQLFGYKNTIKSLPKFFAIFRFFSLIFDKCFPVSSRPNEQRIKKAVFDLSDVLMEPDEFIHRPPRPVQAVRLPETTARVLCAWES